MNGLICLSEKKTIQLRIEDKSKHETVNFILDSNTIRFKFGASEEQDRIDAVKNFFKYTDTHKEVYNFIVPWQVGSELRIYIYRIREMHKEKADFQETVNKVEEFIKDIEFVNCSADHTQEEEIRLLFEYLKSNYEFFFEDGEKLKLNSLKTDDARILLTAIQEDRSIITHNVRDFAPVFAFEKAIWNPVNDKIYQLSPESAKIFNEDETLQDWIERILEKFYSKVPIKDEELILEALKPKNIINE